MCTVLNVRVLGPVRVVRDGVLVRLGAQARAVLATLVLRHDTPVSTDSLVDTLWSYPAPRSARTHVQGLISCLRRALADDAVPDRHVIATEPAGYVLRLAPDQLDLLRYRDAVAVGDRLRRDRYRRGALRHYADALALWSGTPCEDVDRPVVRDLTELLVQAHADLVESWAELATGLGESARVVTVLAPAVARYPYRERMRGLLMSALGEAGRCAEALLVYEQGRRLLADELGIDPSTQLQVVYRQLLAGDRMVVTSRPEQS